MPNLWVEAMMKVLKATQGIRKKHDGNLSSLRKFKFKGGEILQGSDLGIKNKKISLNGVNSGLSVS